MANFFSNIAKKIFGSKSDRDVQFYAPELEKINEYYETYQNLSNDELRGKSLEFKKRIAVYLSEIDQEIESQTAIAHKEKDLQVKEDIFSQIDRLNKDRDDLLEEILKDILPEAFAVVKETATRFTNEEYIEVTATEHDRELAAKKEYIIIDGDKARYMTAWRAGGAEIDWKMVHYDVQLIGGMVLHDGKIAEMATGEGKTLVATLPAYLNGLTGLGVHVVTVNNYLAKRDSEWIGPVLEYLFLTIDCIDNHQPNSDARKAAYACDVIYGTNNEFGFDYLRDNMVRSTSEMVQRKHHFAMIDEVDSVLIDDARTPLIISGPIAESEEEQEYNSLRPKVKSLYEAQKKLATKYLAQAKAEVKEGKIGHKEGEAGLSILRAYHATPKYRPLIKYLSEDGIRIMLQKTENFYMQEQSKHMHIVDEPLYFVIDEKNRTVDLTEKGVAFLSTGEMDANFFTMPDIAEELNNLDASELPADQKQDQKDSIIRDYALKSKRLHAVQQLLKAYTLFEKDEDYVVLNNQVKIVDEQTGRIMEGRRYSDGLHQALEAKEEVDVGELTQTYATVTLQNYFRMYHKLSGMTGTAETEAGEFWEIYKLDVSVIPTNRPIVRDDRQDLVFKTTREKYNAVADEIVKLTQAGRPVLVGTTSVDISEKLSRMLDLREIKHNVLNAKQHDREAEIVAGAGQAGAVTIATNMAGRGTDIKLGPGVKEAGGLAIIGTERHDSRRVDRQLRGRAGRQGDPGSSQFYVSLEDKLMRLFRSERIAKVMDALGHQEGDVIQHKQVTKSIERAQQKVEENNFGIRKRLLEYDDVMNIQREAIYKRRNNALSGERLALDIRNMFGGMTENLVYDYYEAKDYDAFERASIAKLGVELPFERETFETANVVELLEQYQDNAWEHYEKKGAHFKEVLYPVIKNVSEKEGHRYKRIAIPFVSNTTKPLPISADLQTAVDTEGESIMTDIEKAVTLSLIDQNWKEHLRNMDELKDAVQAASFEQKDPLVIYKMEAYNLFENLMYQVNQDVTSYLFEGKMVFEGPDKDVREAKVERTDFSKVQENKEEEAQRRAMASAGGGPPKVQTFKREGNKIGRNDPCPCGSGKKFKQCHGK